MTDRERDRVERLGEHDLVTQGPLSGVVHGLEPAIRAAIASAVVMGAGTAVIQALRARSGGT